MPLLGRHKSLPGSARSSTQNNSSTQTTSDQRTFSSTNTQQQQQQTSSQMTSISSNMTSTATTTAITPPQQSRLTQPAICESPLFGIRRQLPVASRDSSSHLAEQASGSSSSASCQQQQVPFGSRAQLGNQKQQPTTTAQQSNPKNLDQNNNHSNNMVCIGDELSSIPQHITRQQIHYAFTIMDKNSDGLINLHDLSQMLANLGIPIDEAILSHVMSIASKRGEY